MARPALLTDPEVVTWLAAHPSWQRASNTITRAFTFADFSAALAFVVRVGLLAEKHEHHPDIALGWGKANVTWSTHEPKGLTSLDLTLAAATDALIA